MTELHGNLFVVSAPSGAGKSSLIQALLDADASLRLSVSFTTRPPRPGERDGVHYHFISIDRFRDMLAAGEFLESAEVYGHYYGTSQVWIEEQARLGTDIVLEIDWQGASQVRRLFPEAVSLFVLPPSRAALLQRLQGRGQDSEEVIARRLAAAQDDIAQALAFDYLVVNDDFATALADIQAIVRARRLGTRSQMHRLAPLLSALLMHA